MARKRKKKCQEVQQGLFGPVDETRKDEGGGMVLAEYQGQPVRMLTLSDEPWWVAADVCRALELNNTHMAVERLDDDEKGVSAVDTPGGRQQLTVISEAGLYNLIFSSRVERAKDFRRWVAHEVLPAIRKTGRYEVKTTRHRRYERAMGTKDASTVKARLDVANRHKETNRRLAECGAKPNDFRNYHNVKYREWTGKSAPELRADLGIRPSDTPLNHMSDLVLCHNDHALVLAGRIAAIRAKERGCPLTPGEEAEIYAESVRDIRQADCTKLGGEYGLVNDPARGLILDVVPQLPAPAAGGGHG